MFMMSSAVANAECSIASYAAMYLMSNLVMRRWLVTNE